ncbi:MAG: hypothetical protein U0992_14735 [Planctomycetaceae bacterium]
MYRADFGNSILRLRLRDWAVVGLFVLACFVVIPRLCQWFERLPAGIDDRIPYESSEDYWTYRVRIEHMVEGERIPIIGDSVIWGEYVAPAETLSACLNRDLPAPRFANAGLNGAHPLALSGLVANYTDALQDRHVILHCNLLWMSSPERDLQSGDTPINHTRLLPQFVPRIPAYHAPFSERVSLSIDRSVSFFDCVTHIRTRYFDGRDLQSWAIAHPLANPLRQFEQTAPPDTTALRHAGVPWTEQGIEPQDMPWLDLNSSLQWEAWKQTAQRLRARRNSLLVLVGPLNEHLLTDSSRRRHQAVRQQVEEWLHSEEIPYVASAVLPSDEYGDASHPLATGYVRLAKNIISGPEFRDWLAD